MNEYYTASQAIERLKLGRSTFYYFVQRGQIEKITLPLRRQSLYSKEQIDRIAAERDRFLDLNKADFASSVMICEKPTEADISQLADLGREIRGFDNGVWTENVIGAITVGKVYTLRDLQTNQVCGGLALTQVSIDVLRRLLRHEISESDVTAWQDSGLTPSLESPMDLYVLDFLVRPGPFERKRAALLLRYALKSLQAWLEFGFAVGTVSKLVDSSSGERLAQRMGFEPLPVKAISKSGQEGEPICRPYVLDLLHGRIGRPSKDARKPSRLVRDYVHAYQVAKRRQRRYRDADSMNEYLARFLMSPEEARERML